jgi:ribosomal protein S27E
MDGERHFQIICINCDAIGIVLDHPQDAPPSTPIKCRHCGAPRGTLGDLRDLAIRRNID